MEMMVNRRYPLGRLKMELMERFHRLQKDVKTQNGGGFGRTTVEADMDRMELERQFLVQFVNMKVRRAHFPEQTFDVFALARVPPRGQHFSGSSDL